MSSSGDQTVINWNSAVAGIGFSINQMCLSTSYGYAGITAPSTSTSKTTDAKSLLFSMVAVMMALLAFF